jgi:hypothetical protein
MSEYIRCFSLGGTCPQNTIPSSALSGGERAQAVCMDGSRVKGCIYNNAEWFLNNFETDKLIKHDSDELHIFIGGNPDDHENLYAEIDFQIENDHLVFSETSFVFVPKGAAHAIRSVKGLTRPLFHHIIHTDSSFYKAEPAKTSALRALTWITGLRSMLPSAAGYRRRRRASLPSSYGLTLIS